MWREAKYQIPRSELGLGRVKTLYRKSLGRGGIECELVFRL